MTQHPLSVDIIHNMDCLEGMKLLPDKCIDAIIADLPYGVLNKGNKSSQWDKMIPLEALWEQYNRIAKKGCPIILFSQGMFTAKLIMSQPDKWRYNLVWEKDRVSGHLNARRMPLRQHEDIVVFYDSQPVYNPQMRPCLAQSRPIAKATAANTNPALTQFTVVLLCSEALQAIIIIYMNPTNGMHIISIVARHFPSVSGFSVSC